MLLIDELKTPGARASIHPVFQAAQEPFDRDGYWDWLNNCVDQAVVYNIDNVAEYYQDLHKTGWNLMTDFPNVAPVNNIFWMEYNKPWANIDGSGRGHPRDRVGVLFNVGSFDDEDGWIMDVLFVGRTYQGLTFFPLFAYGLAVTPDGQINLEYPVFNPDADPAAIEKYRKVAEGFSPHLHPALLALSFLHCKNVVTKINPGVYSTRQARRLAQRNGDDPPVSFHTLQIEPMKKVITTEGGIATNGLKKALHICRGHFAEYGDEYGKGKLFGKLEGRYWMPAHVRGSSEFGIADKDYNVKAPRKDAA